MDTTTPFSAGQSDEGPDTTTTRLLAARPFKGPQSGRYMFIRTLGQGGFGEVFLARDKELDRRVAVKIWHRKSRLAETVRISCLEEARSLAKLDHPAIVPVYDVGQMENDSMFIVSKYVDGETLGDRLKREPIEPLEAARIAARIADALHHSHQCGLVHRDVKPGNVLLDLEGQAFLIDFGIALREDLLESDTSVMGTPAYMSPEQARGEGHLIDRRSDVFSLGAVFYEMLAGKLPFPGNTVSKVLEQVETTDPPPPSSLNPDVPAELERICLKAMAKRSRDRFLTAKAMLEDLNCFLAKTKELAHSKPRIVPKGLRSFDAGDADFFSDLIPGPRDREGVPEVLRLWQHRIEARDETTAFRIGMLYGPSGCGKSSLIKAGLVPRLSKSVAVVMIEADASETEHRIEQALRRSVINEIPGRPLAEILSSIRKGTANGLAGRSVLIVIDQFEQWLNANPIDAGQDLVEALRQCDGANLQCLILVRDDFWLSASRFMGVLEIDLDQTENVGMVDLFDLDHARRVLRQFGCAYRRLPDENESPEQEEFLTHATQELQENERIIPVRLAVFADMMKSRDWSKENLANVGGARGLGSAFLEESIGDKAANLFLRQHQKAAREVLSALLPEVGTDIKGGMRSFDDLRKRAAEGMVQKEFRKLIKTLDQELRLITPVDIQNQTGTDTNITPSLHYYQLTHDFLVPAIRQWLAGKQLATREGRATLRLNERTQLWSGEQRSRFLPDLWEWANILIYTRSKQWAASQRRMMRVANRFHVTRLIGVIALVLTGIFGYREVRGRLEARSAVRQVVQTEIRALPGMLKELAPVERWATPMLRSIVAGNGPETNDGLRARLALLHRDAAFTDDAVAALLTARPNDVGALRELLRSRVETVSPRLWALALDFRQPQAIRLHAAAALAGMDPRHSSWAKIDRQAAEWLAGESASSLAIWMDLFQPVAGRLAPALREIFADGANAERAMAAAIILADFAEKNSPLLAELTALATPAQLRVLLPALRRNPVTNGGALRDLFNPELPADGDEAQKDSHARQQANVALALLDLGRDALVWPLYKFNPDPRLRVRIIHQAAPGGVSANVFLKRLEAEPDAAIRRALLLTLADYPPSSLPLEGERGLIRRVEDLYRHDADAGVHSIAEWVLTHWGQQSRVEALRDELKAQAPTQERNWFINSQGMTFSVMRGPIEFFMGTDRSTATTTGFEQLHKRIIPRSFAVSTTKITVAQFLEFRRISGYSKIQAEHPIPQKSQTDAMQFCRWLSEKEGISEEQICYPKPASPNDKTAPHQDYLSRTGYRLPTEGEWEYGCRAGTVTFHPLGNDYDFFPLYFSPVTTINPVTEPVTRYRPNDFGLFGMICNVAEWCQDDFVSFSILAKDGDVIDWGSAWGKGTRVFRGRTGIRSEDLRSSSCGYSMDAANPMIGFRIAKTIADP